MAGSFPDWFVLPITRDHPFILQLGSRERRAVMAVCYRRQLTTIHQFVRHGTKADVLSVQGTGRRTLRRISEALQTHGVLWPTRDGSATATAARLQHLLERLAATEGECRRLEQQQHEMRRASVAAVNRYLDRYKQVAEPLEAAHRELAEAHALLDELGMPAAEAGSLRARLAFIFGQRLAQS